MTTTSTLSGPARARAANAAVIAKAGAPGHVLSGGDIPRRPWPTDVVDPVLAFVVYGIPAGQGSKAYKGHRNGKPILAEQSDRVEPWRDAVRHMARLAVQAKARQTGTPWRALDTPVMVSAVVTVPATAAATERGDVYATGTPDLDKIERAIGDALSPRPISPAEAKALPPTKRDQAKARLMEQRRKVAVLHDDSRIVVWDHVAKVYPATTVDSLGYPGVTIQIWRMEDLDAALRSPIRRTGAESTVRAGDLATWARPLSGEDWASAARRLWHDPVEILAADTTTITLRGRGIGDDALRTVLRTLALDGPAALLTVHDDTPARRRDPR